MSNTEMIVIVLIALGFAMILNKLNRLKTIMELSVSLQINKVVIKETEDGLIAVIKETEEGDDENNGSL